MVAGKNTIEITNIIHYELKYAVAFPEAKELYWNGRHEVIKIKINLFSFNAIIKLC